MALVQRRTRYFALVFFNASSLGRLSLYTYNVILLAFEIRPTSPMVLIG